MLQQRSKYQYQQVNQSFAKVVAVINNETNCWLAFRGNKTWSDGEVIRKGDLLTAETAQELFPATAVGKTYGSGV